MRKSLLCAAALSVLGLSTLSTTAQAQQLPTSAAAGLSDGFSIQQFDPAYAGDRFFGVQGANTDGHVSFKPMLLLNYALKPLKVQNASTDKEVGVITTNQLYAHLDGSITLWNQLALNIDIPIALVQSGDDSVGNGAVPSKPTGGKLADLRLGARYRFFAAEKGRFDLGLQGDIYLPTGSKDSLAGDGQVRGHPRLVASGKAGGFVYAANMGVLFRKHLDLGSGEIGTALSFGFAAGVLFLDEKLQVGPELYGNTVFSKDGSDSPFLGSHSSPIEAILGAKLRVSSVVVGAGAGPGFTAAVGTPALRVLASVAWMPEAEPVESDRDHDGIVDKVDACPDEKGISDKDPKKNGCPDTDGDGIFDFQDHCPREKGVADPDPMKNGCPLPLDTDGDGIIDPLDHCPTVPGPSDPDPLKNGCPPPPDKDKDGIPDSEDACIDIPGKADPDPKKNGCPGDTDGDGIRDDLDACPNEKGKPDPDPKKNGCPGSVRVVGDDIIILQQVQFDTAKATIKKVSDGLLDEVAGVLKEHPEIAKLQVEGHTDNRGAAAMNKKLSQDRANAVVKALSTRGVEAGRMTPVGYGQERPLPDADNSTEAGRARNRRVQFKIIERVKKLEHRIAPPGADR